MVGFVRGGIVMPEEKRETPEARSGCKLVCLIGYIGFGIIAGPFVMFIFIMSLDSPINHESLQVGVILLFFFLSALYFWGLGKLTGIKLKNPYNDD